MGEIFGVPVVENEAAGDGIFLMPTVRPVVYIPPGGYTLDEMLAAEQQALIEAYTRAARRGEVGIIRNAKP